MTARVKFVTKSASDVLKVANAALRFKPESSTEKGRALYVVDAKGTLQPIKVRTGVTDGSFTDGIAAGMKVVSGTAQPQSAESASSNPFQSNSQQQRGPRAPGGF